MTFQEIDLIEAPEVGVGEVLVIIAVIIIFSS